MVGSTVFIATILVLSLAIAVANWRRGMTPREIAAVTGGFILVAIALATVGGDDGAMVGIAAFGGGVVQYGVDAHRQRQRSKV
jgi:hypothetical protein